MQNSISRKFATRLGLKGVLARECRIEHYLKYSKDILALSSEGSWG